MPSDHVQLTALYPVFINKLMHKLRHLRMRHSMEIQLLHLTISS